MVGGEWRASLRARLRSTRTSREKRLQSTRRSSPFHRAAPLLALGERKERALIECLQELCANICFSRFSFFDFTQQLVLAFCRTPHPTPSSTHLSPSNRTWFLVCISFCLAYPLHLPMLSNQFCLRSGPPLYLAQLSMLHLLQCLVRQPSSLTSDISLLVFLPYVPDFRSIFYKRENFNHTEAQGNVSNLCEWRQSTRRFFISA